VIPIHVPRLRERLEDVPAIVQHMVARFSREHNRRPSRFSPAAIEALQQAQWRGNIRELGNVVERLLIMTDGDVIEADDVRHVVRPVTGVRPASQGAASAGPAAVPAAAPAVGGPLAGPAPTTLREFKEWSERNFLVGRLRETGWNISKTAEEIDTPRSNLYKKLEQYNISQETDG
jgi:two-component system nitrogen regulation response regulator NtrX